MERCGWGNNLKSTVCSLFGWYRSNESGWCGSKLLQSWGCNGSRRSTHRLDNKSNLINVTGSTRWRGSVAKLKGCWIDTFLSNLTVIYWLCSQNNICQSLFKSLLNCFFNFQLLEDYLTVSGLLNCFWTAKLLLNFLTAFGHFNCNRTFKLLLDCSTSFRLFNCFWNFNCFSTSQLLLDFSTAAGRLPASGLLNCF